MGKAAHPRPADGIAVNRETFREFTQGTEQSRRICDEFSAQPLSVFLIPIGGGFKLKARLRPKTQPE